MRVRECPGFLVNRVLVRALAGAYARAAERIGADRAAADAAASPAGRPRWGRSRWAT